MKPMVMGTLFFLSISSVNTAILLSEDISRKKETFQSSVLA